MVFIGTEHNGLSHTVCTFQILSYLMCYFPDAVFYDDIVIIVGIVIDTVFYQITVDVSLPPDRSPFITYIGGNVHYLKGSEKTIFNAFLKAVCVDRFTEITDT